MIIFLKFIAPNETPSAAKGTGAWGLHFQGHHVVADPFAPLSSLFAIAKESFAFSDARLGWHSMRIERALMRGGDRLHLGGEKAHAPSTPCHPLWKQPLARSLHVDIIARSPERRG